MDSIDRIKSGDLVSVKLTKRQWVLILEHAFVAPEVEEQIHTACLSSNMPTIVLAPGDLDDLIGWMAGATNHARSQRLMLELNQVCDLLIRFQDQYDGKIVIIDDAETFFGE